MFDNCKFFAAEKRILFQKNHFIKRIIAKIDNIAFGSIQIVIHSLRMRCAQIVIHFKI
ncbi:MAG: DUF2292 domain-containing protein [Bacteroidales bacterium]|nr:DUF2292 domain-containing protein [Bacteroidales bacterium]